MRILIFVALFLPVILSLYAQQSTTGKYPGEGVDIKGFIFNEKADAEYLIPGVPAYEWRYGCGPTALGMVLGYYDINSYPDIFPGDASTQTPLVNQCIASTDHYNDYAIPLDYYPNLLADVSEPPAGDEHSNNCIADFMFTSRSSYANYYGWSWSSDLASAFDNYLLHVSSYQGLLYSHYLSSFSFNAFIFEMLSNKPMMALVHTDGDGNTDHFITLVGYRQQSGMNYYACYHTWDQLVHWYEWKEISPGQLWGIYNVNTIEMNILAAEELSINKMNIYPFPASTEIFVNESNALVKVYDLTGKLLMQTISGEGGRIDISSFSSGLYIIEMLTDSGRKSGKFMVE